MEHEEIQARHPKQPPLRFMHKWALTMQIENELEPHTVAEALGSAHWKEAIEKEYESVVHNNTWELILLLPNRTIVSGK